jgi:hypothetical protein
MKSARPGKSDIGPLTGLFRHRTGDDASRPPGHLKRRTAREGQQQDAVRAHPLEHQVGDPVGKRHGLASAGARDHQ